MQFCRRCSEFSSRTLHNLDYPYFLFKMLQRKICTNVPNHTFFPENSNGRRDSKSDRIHKFTKPQHTRVFQTKNKKKIITHQVFFKKITIESMAKAFYQRCMQLRKFLSKVLKRFFFKACAEIKVSSMSLKNTTEDC